MYNLTIIENAQGHKQTYKGHKTAQQARALGAVVLSYQIASDASEAEINWCIWQKAVFDDNVTLLNIGLDIPAHNGGGTLAPHDVLAGLKKLGVKVIAQSVHTSKTEKTLIVAIKKAVTVRQLFTISRLFCQDAVTQRYSSGAGILVGPKACDWGKYNGEDFLLLNGEFAS